MVRTLPKNSRQQTAQISAEADITRKKEERDLVGRREFIRLIQWQREAWKEDSGWTEYNGVWESEDVTDMEKPVHTYIHTYTT